jgi:hypothetical protein
VGLALNHLGALNLLTPQDFAILRRLVGYVLLNVTVGSFLWWLLRLPQHPKR